MKKQFQISATPIRVTAIPASEKINAADHGSNFLPSRNAAGEIQTIEQNGVIKTPGAMLLSQEVTTQTVTETGSYINKQILSCFQGCNQEDSMPIGTELPGVMQVQLSHKPFFRTRDNKMQEPVVNPNTGEIMQDESGMPYYRQVRYIADPQAETQVWVEEPILRESHSESAPAIKSRKNIAATEL